MMQERKCPALVVSAPGSHQGKTTVTAGLAAYQKARGRRVRVFKVGPDFLDPMILEHASGNPVYQLDLWMMGEAHCRRLLYDAAGDADLILVEGVMGLYDGRPSTADLATSFGLPVLLVIDAAGTAQTFHAVAHGLATFNPNLKVYGAVANGVTSERHEQMLSDDTDSNQTVRYLGGLPQIEQATFSSRHLGLTQATEIPDLDLRIAAVAQSIEFLDLTVLPPEVMFSLQNEVTHDRDNEVTHEQTPLEGVRIAVARDAAFSFLYPGNVDLLQQLGAQLSYFSPLDGTTLPECDSVYLPGGYPELHMHQLENRIQMKQSLKQHFAGGRNIYAECGGMLYLMDTLVGQDGNAAQMVGLIPGNAYVANRLKSLSYQIMHTNNGPIRGHTFHYSTLESSIKPAQYTVRRHDQLPGEAIYRINGLVASYAHLYFPSNPKTTVALFKAPAKVNLYPHRVPLSATYQC